MHKIKIWQQGQPQEITVSPDETLHEILAKHGIHIPAPCGGNGTCRKCAVGTSHGIKLSCNTPAREVTDIYPPNAGEAALAILDIYESQRPFENDKTVGCGIAIDIGTTTIAFELLDMTTGRRIATHSTANSQRSLGADVVTRIKQATQGYGAPLHEYVLNDIRRGIAQLLIKTGLPVGDISAVSIAGNTTMLHLLQNMPCDTLGAFPFTPVDISMRRCAFSEVFGVEAATSPPQIGESQQTQGENIPQATDTANAKLLILPGISTFVGADIAAGILCCQDPGSASPNLLIDLGTNGEMALFSPDRILVTSTAAGPAFEAANISCGSASIPGAIAKVRYLPETNVFIYDTINNLPPMGICGTGVVDIAAELVRHNLVDETGRLEDPYFDSGVELAAGISFTQKDMREIQLAKSAVRSGIEILLDVAGYGYNDIGKVFLAGGFGHKINMESAVILGLIPPEVASKIVTVGNTSLGGAAHVLLSAKAATGITAIASKAEEVSLSTHPRFNDLFMEHMMFE